MELRETLVFLFLAANVRPNHGLIRTHLLKRNARAVKYSLWATPDVTGKPKQFGNSGTKKKPPNSWTFQVTKKEAFLMANTVQATPNRDASSLSSLILQCRGKRLSGHLRKNPVACSVT